MPVTGDGAGLKNRGGRCDPDQNDGSRRDSNRNCRVHDDAERAMVGIAFLSVKMGHLGDGEQSQQGQAQDRCDT
jgi:hypothetical protein